MVADTALVYTDVDATPPSTRYTTPRIAFSGANPQAYQPSFWGTLSGSQPSAGQILHTLHAWRGTLYLLSIAGYELESVTATGFGDVDPFVLDLKSNTAKDLEEVRDEYCAITVAVRLDALPRLVADLITPDRNESALIPFVENPDGDVDHYTYDVRLSEPGYLEFWPLNEDGTFQTFLSSLRNIDKQYFHYVLEKLRTGLDTRSNAPISSEGEGYELSPVLSGTGLRYDPSTWAILARSGSTARQNRVRGEAFTAVGELVWSYVSADASRLTDFLYGEAYFGEPSTGDSLLTLLCKALAAKEAGKSADDSDVIRKARRIASDWVRAIEHDSRTYSRLPNMAPLPAPITVDDFETSCYIEILADAQYRGLLGFLGDNQSVTPGADTSLPALKSTVANTGQWLLNSFNLNYWVHAPTARDYLKEFDSFLYQCYWALPGRKDDDTRPANPVFGDGTTDYVPDDSYNIRITLNYPEEFGDLSRLIEAARDLAKSQIDEIKNNRQKLTSAEIAAMMDLGNAALVTIDTFFELEEKTVRLDEATESFLVGLKRGLGEDFEGSVEQLFKRHMRALPVMTLLQPVFTAGVVYGAGQYVVQTLSDLGEIILDPQKFLDDTMEMIEMLLYQPFDETAEMFGEGAGASIRENMDALNAQTNAFSYVFELGRLFGPLILEVVISLIFEAYVIAPLMEKAGAALKAAFKSLTGFDKALYKARHSEGIAADLLKYNPDVDIEPGGTRWIRADFEVEWERTLIDKFGGVSCPI